MGLIVETAGVFAFLRDLWQTFPLAIQLLIYGTFGGVVFIAVLRGVWR